MRKTNAIVPTCLLLCAATTGFAQTQIDLGRQGRSPDFGGADWTRPAKTGVLLPQTCSIGELYFKSDAPEGQNLYGCTTPNTWTLQSSGASGGGTPTAGTLNFSKSFSNQTAVTVNGVEHGFQSANLIVQVVNDATPGVRIEPDAVTIHPTTFDVSVTFQTPQSGRIIVNGTGILTSFEKSFWKSTNVSVTGSEHGLGSAKFGWFCFDAGSPKRWIEPNEVTIDPTTYDFQATFASEQSGSCTLVAGGGQGSTAGSSVNSVFGRTGTVLAQAGDYVASQIQNTPSGNLTATDLQSAVNELDAAKSATSHGHTLAGDATGSLTGVTVSRIQGRSMAATAPLDGQTLVWSTAGNHWQPGTIAGGGGASNAADLNDFKVAKTSGAVLTLNSGCSVAKPCVARFGNRSYAFTTSATATISGGTGQARWYVDPAGTIILGHAGLTVSCSGCVAQNNLTQFPTESIPLFVWNATSGVWDDTGSDYRAYLSTKQVAAGTGVTVSESGGVATVAVDTATVGTYSSGTAAPTGNCSVGAKYLDTTANKAYECTSTNTWTETTGGGGSGAPTDAQYVTLAANASLDNERVLTPRDGLTATDGGAGGNYTLDFNPTDPSWYYVRDDFTGYNSGELAGWRAMSSLGTPTTQAGETNHPGILKLSTGATSGTEVIYSRGFNQNNFDTFRIYNATGWDYRWIIKFGSITNIRFSVDLADVYGYQENSRCNIRFDPSADASFQYTCYKSNVGTIVDSTVDVAADTWYHLRIWSTTAGTVRFSINGGNEKTINTNLPEVMVGPVFYLRNTAAEDKQAFLDFFALKYRGLSR